VKEFPFFGLIEELSWPAKAGHPGDEEFNQRADARWLGGPVAPGHDTRFVGKLIPRLPQLR
jgi:hypothetical protein